MLSMQPAPGAQPGMPPQQPAMMPNPAFQEWMQLKQVRDAEVRRREEQFKAGCQLIKDDAAKSFKIDIEADSTVAADEQAEKQARTEFLSAFMPYLTELVPLTQNPATLELAGELLKFGVRAFPAARPLEDAVDTAIQKLIQSPPQPPPGKQGSTKSPMEIQAEAQEAQGKMQVDSQANQVKLTTDQQANAVKLQQIQAQTKIASDKLAAENDRAAAEMAMRGREMQGKEQLETSKIEHMQARDTMGLV